MTLGPIIALIPCSKACAGSIARSNRCVRARAVLLLHAPHPVDPRAGSGGVKDSAWFCQSVALHQSPYGKSRTTGQDMSGVFHFSIWSGRSQSCCCISRADGLPNSRPGGTIGGSNTCSATPELVSINGVGKGTASAVPLQANKNEGFKPLRDRRPAQRTIYETSSSAYLPAR